MTGARIMLVEDNATVAEDCREGLLGLGYAVPTVVASGREAVERAGVEMPDIVVILR